MTSIQQHLYHPLVNAIKHSWTILFCPSTEFVTVYVGAAITHLVIKVIKDIKRITNLDKRIQPSQSYTTVHTTNPPTLYSTIQSLFDVL